jgi:hypothetical protein
MVALMSLNCIAVFFGHDMHDVEGTGVYLDIE